MASSLLSLLVLPPSCAFAFTPAARPYCAPYSPQQQPLSLRRPPQPSRRVSARTVTMQDTDDLDPDDLPASAQKSGAEKKRLAKVHSSTVALIPPDDAWGQLQAVRHRLKDKGLYRWPPHINLLYPFAVESHIPRTLDRMQAALRHVEPFEVTLANFSLFRHKKSSTLWLCPETRDAPGALDCLQAALQAAVPECHEQRSKYGNKFTPHMTVTHFDLSAMAFEECEKLRGDLQKEWSCPVTFTCREVHVMTRQGQMGQFRRRARILLGSNAGTSECECECQCSMWV